MVRKMSVAVSAAWVVGVAVAAASDAPPPIRSVQIGPRCELRVNGRPFIPLMSWLQEPKRYPKLKSLGFNAFCGNHEVPAVRMCEAAKAAGGYAIPHFDKAAAGHTNLLAWIHGDEPDLPKRVSDAKITPGKGLRLNPKTPLYRIVDGTTTSWSVLDPLAGAEITIHLEAPATIHAVAIWPTVSKGLSVARDVVLLGDGRKVLEARLEPKRMIQKFRLPQPAKLERLTFRVVSVHKGENEWGSIGEIHAYDAAGKNVLLARPRQVPRKTPEQLAREYQAIKGVDRTRPIFVTFTAYFMRKGSRYGEEDRRSLYPAYVKSTDVVGFDIYPIYGWNRPDWLYRVAEGVSELRRLAGPTRPVYAWIETSKGSQWITYDRQKDVLPRHTRSEVWMAIIRGATAIGYFTHAWRPTFTEFRPTPRMQEELKRLNGQVTRLAPAILGEPAGGSVGIESAGRATCHVKATRHGGWLYVFAQNIDMKGRAGQATVHVGGLKAGAKVEVVDERRALTAGAEKFDDRFDVLQEHVYRIPDGSIGAGREGR